MKEGLLGATLRRVTEGASGRRPTHMIVHVGLDLSRRRLDYCLLDERGERLEVGAAAQKVKGLAPLACKTDRIDAWVLAEPEKLPGWGGQSPPSLRMPSGREGLRA